MKHLKTYQDITTIEGLAKINPAFDKMSVLAENLDKLEDIYNFLFKYKEYVKVLLDTYVSTNGVVTSGDTAFDITKLKDLEANKIKIPGTEYYGLISLGFIDNDKSTTGIKLGLYTKDDLLLGEIKYGYDPVEEKFYTLIPTTHREIPESIVNVEYLNLTKEEILAKFNEFKSEITPRLDKLEADFKNLKSRVSTLENQIVQKAAQSDLDELKAQVGGIKPGLDVNSIKGIFWSPNQTYTTGKDLIWVEAEIGKTYTGNELYTECVHDETTHTTTLSGQLNTGTYMCLSPSKITLSYTASGTAYNGNTLTGDYYSHQEERGSFAPVTI